MKMPLRQILFTIFAILVATALHAATFIYSYDSLNRLTNAAYSDGSRESYSYDPAGNRLSRNTSTATVKLDVASPSVPANLTTNSFTPSQLSITWNRAFDTGGSGLAGYQIYVNGSLVATTTGTNISLSGLSPNSQYCLTVAAFDHDGNISAASLPLCITTSGGADTEPPLLTVLFPTNNAVFFTDIISVIGTATDAGQGDSGIGSVTLNGLPVTGGIASGTATSQWSIVVSLVPGFNPFRIVARDASINQNRATNDVVFIRAIPSNQPPAVVGASMLSSSQFATTLAGNLGTTYGVWASTNLADWMLLTNVTLTNWVQQLVDMDAYNYLYRFYRFSVSANSPSTNATVIANGLNSPSSLVLDAGNVYFADNTSTDGIIKSVSKSGGSVTTLFTGATLYDGCSYHGVAQLQVTNSTIYGHYGGYIQLNIFSGSETGGVLTTLASISGGVFIGVVGTNLFYSSSFSYLNEMPATGGSSTQLVSGYFIRGYAFDSGAIYFSDYNSKDVKKYVIPSGTLTTLIGGNSTEGSIFIDNTNLYFNIDGSIKVVPKAGGSVSTLVSSSDAYGFASDGTYVYYVENHAIKSIPVTGGVPSSLINIPASSLSGLVMDDSFIYWNDISGGTGAGKILRMAKPVHD
jgi:YD repeat-containing protein